MSLGHALFLAYVTGWINATLHAYDLDTQVQPVSPKGAYTFALAALITLLWPIAVPIQWLSILRGKR